MKLGRFVTQQQKTRQMKKTCIREERSVTCQRKLSAGSKAQALNNDSRHPLLTAPQMTQNKEEEARHNPQNDQHTPKHLGTA